MEKRLFNNVENTLELKLGHSQIINFEKKILYLKTGNLNLFFKYKSRDGNENRHFFINNFTSHSLIFIPEVEIIKDIIISASSDCVIDIISPTELDIDSEEMSSEVCKLIIKLILTGIDGLEKFENKYRQILFNINQDMICDFKGNICNPKTDDVKWIVAENDQLLMYDQFVIPKNSVVPLTNTMWYSSNKGLEYRVIDTKQIIENGEFISQLLNFWNIFNEISSYFYKESVGDSMRQIYTNIESEKDHWKYSYDNLFKIISPKKKGTSFFIESDPLLGCLEIIGKYEKITFSKPAYSDKLFTPLSNILKSSKIRSRNVDLSGKWYNRNHGAFLAYSKENNSPIALIPFGRNKYKAFFYSSKTVEIVTPEIADRIKPKAVMFFASFPNDKVTGKKLINFGLQYVKKDLVSFFVIGAIVALLSLLIPISIGYLIDNVVPSNDINELTQIFIVLLTIVISMGILSFAQSLSVLRIEGILNFKLQSAILDRLLSLKVKFFQNYSAGDLAERSMGIDKIRGVLSGAVLNAIISFIFSLFYLALLFYYDVNLALIGLALGLIIVIFTVLMSYLGFKHVMVIRYLEVVLTGFLFQIINGMNKIRITNSKERVFSQWVGRYSIQKKHYVGKRKIIVIGAVFGACFPLFSAVFIFMKAHELLYTGNSDFTIGNYISFNSAFVCFQGALLQMSMATVPLLTIKPIYNMFKPIIDAETEFNIDSENPGELKGEISVSNLSFRYQKELPLILDKINFTIYEGEFIAIVGGSGSGKSTLFRLLLGFETPSEGNISYDQKQLHKVDVLSLRRQISVVLQNQGLMQGTVLYNIIGNTTLTEEDAWEAARKAGCADEIEKLPKKMYTEIISGDSLLSGGQVQRIVIAKAFARNSKIFFFDEATSALDNLTQNIISSSIDKLNATKIIIAHRLSTIKNANRILVLDKGNLIEQGTYSELIAKNGYFADLAKRQFA